MPTRRNYRRSYRRNYPRHGSDVLCDNFRCKRGVRTALRELRHKKPWRGTIPERVANLQALHLALCEVYGLKTRLTIIPRDCDSGGSNYRPGEDRITLIGRLSVVTYLHEFAHALGRDEWGACRWSLNLFRRIFRRSFASCHFEGHMLIR